MFKPKTYRQIESSRNTRLWITSVILPVGTLIGTGFISLYNGNLEFRYNVNQKINDAKNWFKHTFKKKEK